MEITTAQASVICGNHQQTIRRYIAAGLLIPTRQLPGATGSLLLDFREVAEFAAERALRAAGVHPDQLHQGGKSEPEHHLDVAAG